MDLFNTKKIDKLIETIETLTKKVDDLEKYNNYLKNLDIERFKKTIKPKYKIGDKLTYTYSGHSYWINTGFVVSIGASFNRYTGEPEYEYEICNKDGIYKYSEPSLKQSKN